MWLFHLLTNFFLTPTVEVFHSPLYWGDIFGTIGNIGYIIFAGKRSYLAWPISLISTFIYIIMFPQLHLLANTGLQIIYVLLAIYGWKTWLKTSAPASNPGADIHRLTMKKLSVLIAISIILSLIGIAACNYLDPEHSHILDAILTSTSIVNTWVEIKKYVESWVGWIIIDIGYTVIYWEEGIYLSAILFIYFFFYSFYAYRRWLKEYNEYRKINENTLK